MADNTSGGNNSKMPSDIEMYESVKTRLGFRYWWLDQRDSTVEIILDGKPIDTFVEGILPDFQFGTLVKADRTEDQMFIKFQGSKNKKPIIMYLLDFTSQGNSFSDMFGECAYDAEAFCHQFDSILEDLSFGEEPDVKEDHTLDPDRFPNEPEASEPHLEPDYLENKRDAAESLNDSISASEIDYTTFDDELSSKEIGICHIDVDHCTPAMENHRIRPIDKQYVQNIVSYCKRSNSGLNFKFPQAIGNVHTDLTKREDIENSISAGDLTVEVIDGNHTTKAMKELLQAFPDEQMFKMREVRLYKNLTRAEAIKLGLKGNEIAAQSRPTSTFDILKIIREDMISSSEGKVTPAFRRHVNNLLDVKADERTRLKRASELLKLASMEEDCWAAVEDIFARFPNQKSYIFNDVCQLSKEHALPLLKKVADGTIKPAALPHLAKALPTPPLGSALIVQCGKQKVKTKRIVPSSTTSKEEGLKVDQTMKRKLVDLQTQIAAKDRKIQDLQNQLLSGRQQLQHIRSLSDLKDQSIKTLQENNQVLKERLALKEKELKSSTRTDESLPLKVDSRPVVQQEPLPMKRQVMTSMSDESLPFQVNFKPVAQRETEAVQSEAHQLSVKDYDATTVKNWYNTSHYMLKYIEGMLESQATKNLETDFNFQPGDLAWAKVKGYNWWPSLVCNDPEAKTCIKTVNKKTQCHVQFFDERRSRAWVHAKDIKPFKGSADPEFQRPGGTFYSKSKSVIAAVEETDKYISRSRIERLRIEHPTGTEMAEPTLGFAGDSAVSVKTDPDEEEEELEEMKASEEMTVEGDAGRIGSSSPESILTEMKPEPPDEMDIAGAGEVTVAVNIKEEISNEGPDEEEDYSESEMETISKETQDKAKTVEGFTEIKKKPTVKLGPKSSRKSGPKSAGLGSRRSSEESHGSLEEGSTTSVDAVPSTSKEPVRTTYKISDIPKRMKTPFVLLSSKGIPPDASPEKPVILKPDKGKTPRSATAKKTKTSASKGGKTKSKGAARPVDNGLEEELMGSIGRRKSKPKVSYREDDLDFEDEVMDLEEMEEEPDSEEDPGWMPSKERKRAKAKRKLEGSSESEEEDESDPEFDLEEESGSRKKSAKRSKNVSLPLGPGKKFVSRPPVIVEEPGFQPTVGDYLVDKNTIKDGIAPTIWLFKKGGIIQKYNRIEEDGEVLYESAQWFSIRCLQCAAPTLSREFSDWWDDFGDRYAVVKTQVKFKYQNKVKVSITEWPEDMASWENPVNDSVSSSKSDRKTSANKENKSPSSKTAGKETNESEVSSTTTYGDEEFQIGCFVIDKKDLKNIDNFPIWKIESGILLKKFEMNIVKGKMMHKPVKVYRGYRDIGEFYQPVKIKRVIDLMSDYVEVEEGSRPKLSYDESMEEESEKNPLLQHFYVYLQILLSQALEPGFLEEVLKKKEETYMTALAEIDKLIKQKMDQIERKLRWNTGVKAALQKCPFLREVHKPVENSVCEAIQGTEETVEETIFLFGDDYDKENLNSSKGQDGSQEFKIGKTAASNVPHYHLLCHFKYNVYEKCKAKIKLVQESKYGAPSVEETMDACLHNKAWVLQNFQDLMELIQKS